MNLKPLKALHFCLFLASCSLLFSSTALHARNPEVPDPRLSDCGMDLAKRGAVVNPGSDPDLAFQMGTLMGAISAQTTDRGAFTVSKFNETTRTWAEEVTPQHPLKVLALTVLASESTSHEKLARIQLIHFRLVYGHTVVHPDEGQATLRDSETELQTFVATPLSQLTGWDERYRKGGTRAAKISDLTYVIDRNRNLLNNRHKVMFALLDSQSADFKNEFLDATVAADMEPVTAYAASRLGLPEQRVLAYLTHLSDHGRTFQQLHSLEVSPGIKLSDDHYRDLFLRNLKANAGQTPLALAQTPQHLLTENFIRQVFNQLEADPWAGFPPVHSEEADWVPNIMNVSFRKTLEKRGIDAHIVYTDEPTTEISTSNWSNNMPRPLTLLILPHN